ncbi:MAG: FHA domain-containing protein [Vicinamibacterales bacterium]
MERVIFRHLTGSKALEVETFPLSDFRLIQIGRDPVCDLRFDATRDDLVGRLHARIERDPADPHRFTLVDLGSRNGTFLNQQRITAPAVLSPGDVLQFGPGGPQLEFQIDPPPEGLMKTRLAPQAGALEPTRVAPVAGKTAVGAATVERMVADAQKTTRKSAVIAATIAAVAIVSIGAAAWRIVRPPMAPAITAAGPAAVSATDIAERNAEATVFIEMSWKLILPGTGEQLYQEHLPPQRRGQQPVPLYLRLPDGTIEPALTLERGRNGLNQPIGSQSRGSGFVVTNDGFILTNRHVGAPWETSYTSLQPGVVYDPQTRKMQALERPPARWVPAASKVLGRRALVGKNVEGRLDYLDVTFARNRLRVPAKLVRVSDKHDAALIKVDLPQPVKKVELFDNYDTVRPGMTVTIMGYPARSPEIVVGSTSQDPFSRESQVRVVPDPTVTPTSIGRVLRGSQRPSDGSELEYFSGFGDSYQLKDDAGGGNSGGPLFDDQGRVIGIYYAGRNDGSLGFAVPIKYGLELMTVTAVVR